MVRLRPRPRHLAHDPRSPRLNRGRRLTRPILRAKLQRLHSPVVRNSLVRVAWIQPCSSPLSPALTPRSSPAPAPSPVSPWWKFAKQTENSRGNPRCHQRRHSERLCVCQSQPTAQRDINDMALSFFSKNKKAVQNRFRDDYATKMRLKYDPTTTPWSPNTGPTCASTAGT